MRFRVGKPPACVEQFHLCPIGGQRPPAVGRYALENARQGHVQPGNGAVGHALSGERAFEKQVADAIARGEKPPERAQGLGIYGRPREGAEVFDINAGE